MLTLWRERVGYFIATLFFSIFLYLSLRPLRIHGASPGGLVGEVGGEILRALASTAGAWVLCLSGLALSIVLATNLSLARAGQLLYKVVRRTGPALSAACDRAGARIKAAAAVMAQSFRRREMAAESDGTAALPPPVVRVNLADRADEVRAPGPLAKEQAHSVLDSMPRDLEISLTDEVLADRRNPGAAADRGARRPGARRGSRLACRECDC